MALPTVEDAKAMALEFCKHPRFAQMITFNSKGEPRGRTLGAVLRPDWTVEITSFNQFARASQLERNPNMMLIWNDGALASGHESGKVPQVAFAIGKADVLRGERFMDWYRQRPGGPIRGMTPEQAAEAMSLILFKADQLRLEGFAAPGTTLDFEAVTSGMTINLKED